MLLQQQQHMLLSGQGSQQRQAEADGAQKPQQQEQKQEQQQEQQQLEQQEHKQLLQQQETVPHHLRTWQPKWQLGRVRSVKGVLRMVVQHGHAFSPGQWAKAFVQVRGSRGTKRERMGSVLWKSKWEGRGDMRRWGFTGS